MLKNISIIFVSIFLESLPFIFLGALISAIIETYITDEKIVKIIPKNKILGTFVGIFLGIFIPACDCAVIPISKRLIKKKVPLNVAISFMLSSPIINPVVLISTYLAFYKSYPKIFYFRIILGVAISFVVGLIIGIVYKNKKILKDNDMCCCMHNHDNDHDEGCAHDDDDDDDLTEFIMGKKKKIIKKDNKLLGIINHTFIDMYEIIKYLIFGALIASIIQVLLPRNILLIFNKYNILSILILMIFAYLISLCSTSDSFIGKSLISSFSKSSVLAYLLLGPMIDIKNTFVLLGNYNRKFVFSLISLIFIVTLISSLLVVKMI